MLYTTPREKECIPNLLSIVNAFPHELHFKKKFIDHDLPSIKGILTA